MSEGDVPVRFTLLSVRVVGVVLFVVTLMSFGLSIVAAWRYRELAVCQAGVTDNLYERTRVLTDVGASERAAERRRGDALDDLLTDPVVRKTPRTSADDKRIQDLYDVFVDAAEKLKVERALADRARADNPVPAPLSDTCRP